MNLYEMLQEVIDRVRRIETKLTRLIAGEEDQGVTVVDHALAHNQLTDTWDLRFKTGNVTLSHVMKILTEAKIDRSVGWIRVFDGSVLLFRMHL